MALNYSQLIAYIDGLYQNESLSEQDYINIIIYILANGDTENAPRDLIQIRRGDEANLPTLAQGELAFTLDTNILYVGGINGNVRIVDENVVNVKKYGAIGNGIADDTEDILTAFAIASETKKPLYFPKGNYIITQKLTVQDQTVVKIIGEGQDNTKLLFNVVGYALEVQSYYTRGLIIENLSIASSVQDNTRHGLIVQGGWGRGVTVRNANITNFGGDTITLNEAFNSSFENMELRGYNSGGRQGKLLKIIKDTSFGSNVVFKNVVFHVAKIGVQNLAGSAYSFIGCTFENLDLFLNVEQLSGLSMYMNFEGCWFELVDNGIMNAQINETTLSPIVPITNLAAIERLYFSANMVSTPSWTNFLDKTINPYKYKNWSQNGYKLNDGKELRTKSLDETIAPSATYTKLWDLSDLNFAPNNAYRQGNFTIISEITDNLGNKMRAMFVSDGYMVFKCGDVYDPAAIGTGNKIDPVWAEATQLTLRAYAPNIVNAKHSVVFNEL